MQFKGMKISRIESDGESVQIGIDYAIIIKNMDDAEQDTKWYGGGVMKVNDLVIDSDDIPPLPAVVSNADVKDNQMTYRDEVVIPIQNHGNVGITLHFENHSSPVKFIGERMSFDLSGHEKYIEHLK